VSDTGNECFNSVLKLAPYFNNYQAYKHSFESGWGENAGKFKTSNSGVLSNVIDVGKKNFIFVSRLTIFH
jgi:hypothetical protein